MVCVVISSLLHLTAGQECFRAREDFLYVPSLKLDVCVSMRGNLFAGEEIL